MHQPGNLKDRMSEAYQGASPNSRFLSGEVPAQPTLKARLGGAGAASALVHVAIVALLIFIATRIPELTPDSPFDTPSEIVWLQTPGPGGGGGGGGNRMPDPPKAAELPGKDKVTVPVAKPPAPKPDPPKEVPKPEPLMNIPAVTTAASVQELPGVISAVPSATISQGSGSGGGAGTGTGTGIGPGQGTGLGPGSGGGTGGGVYRPGNGVISPRLLKEVKPNYTGDAMRAKIQGIVTMEAVVMPDGSVGQVQITRSLDSTFGLDQEAIRTVKLWRFAPGTRQGVPVPVLVEIEMTFTLR
jgi:TonB family protein